MAGCTKGTGPRIERMYAKALHWWCASHQLNLVIVGSCTVLLIRNMIGTTDQVHVLIMKCMYMSFFKNEYCLFV